MIKIWGNTPIDSNIYLLCILTIEKNYAKIVQYTKYQKERK